MAVSCLPADRLEVRIAAGAGPDERIIELVALGESWRRRSRRLAEIVRLRVRRGPPHTGRSRLMLLLCLDTATPQVGVAIGSDDQVIGRVQLARPQHHAEHLAPAIDYLLEQLDLSLDQLSASASASGPGSSPACGSG